MASAQPSPMPSISTIHKALADFQLSPSTFRILYTISSPPCLCHSNSPSSSSQTPLPLPKLLYILDSSFNPPTLAHLDMAISALRSHRHALLPGSSSCRLLLLLATQNADKPVSPASFEQRLTMMGLVAGQIVRLVRAREGRKAKVETSSRRTPSPPVGSDVNAHNDRKDLESGVPVKSYRNNNSNNNDEDEDDEDPVTVDIGVTKKPYFHDKAAAIAASGAYYNRPSHEWGGGEDANQYEKWEQVYIVGFDTLIRLLDPKYYPPSRTSLRALDTFFRTSRVRVTRRAGGNYGGLELQDEYLGALAAGEREEEGGRREWAGRIQLVGESGEEEKMISSTKVRDAMKKGDQEVVKRFVPEDIRSFILDQEIYR